MSDQLRKRRGSKEGFKTYGTTTSYGTTSSPTVQVQPSPKSYQSDITDSPKLTTNKKFEDSPSYSSQNTSSNNEQGHVGSLKSNYYQQVRQQLKEEGPSTGQWIYDAIQDMLYYIYQTVVQSAPLPFKGKSSEEFPEVEIGIDDMYIEKLEKFKNYVNVTYSVENQVHEKLLQRLWDLSSPGIQLDERISEMWKDIGFQGKDPATDFRGVGVYGLWNLIFFAETFPKKYKRLLDKTKKTNGAYPFVIAGLNVTMMLYEILGFGMHAKKAKNTQSRKKFVEMLCNAKGAWDQENWYHVEEKITKEEVLLDFGESSPKPMEKSVEKKKRKKRNLLFEQIYVAGFTIMDQEWYGMNATYFAFPKVLEAARSRVQDLIENEWNSIEDVIAYNKKSH